jgi:hypothetical protein
MQIERMESDDEQTFTTLGRQAFVVLAKLSTEQKNHDEEGSPCDDNRNSRKGHVVCSEPDCFHHDPRPRDV